MSSEIIKEEAKIIVISTQKGGAGKTDTAFNVAGGLVDKFSKEDVIKRVCLLDIDPQHTAYEMWEENEEPTFEVIRFDEDGTEKNSIQNKVRELSKIYDYIIIDCPPTAEKRINYNEVAKLVNICYLLADLVIVPVPLRKIHIYASIKTQSLLKEMIEVNKNLKVRILINKYKKRSAITKKWESTVRMGSIFPFFNVISSDRTSHENATDGGKSVLDYKGRSRDLVACSEVRELAKEVIEIL